MGSVKIRLENYKRTAKKEISVDKMVFLRIFINFEAMIRKYVPLVVFSCLLLTACSNQYHRFASGYRFSSPTGAPDYSNPDYWAAHPYKWDPSDSVPLHLRGHYQRDTTVDVFFI